MPPYLAGRYKRSTAWDGSWVRGGVGGGHIQFHSIRVMVTVLAKLKTGTGGGNGGESSVDI
jgi:hypothetical protein